MQRDAPSSCPKKTVTRDKIRCTEEHLLCGRSMRGNGTILALGFPEPACFDRSRSLANTQKTKQVPPQTVAGSPEIALFSHKVYQCFDGRRVQHFTSSSAAVLCWSIATCVICVQNSAKVYVAQGFPSKPVGPLKSTWGRVVSPGVRNGKRSPPKSVPCPEEFSHSRFFVSVTSAIERTALNSLETKGRPKIPSEVLLFTQVMPTTRLI